jgi:gp16 family phage-associated protein
MKVTLHETEQQYLDEYRRIRARLMEQGSSVADWCRKNGYDRQLVVPALQGKKFGRKGLEARAKIIRTAFGNG